MNIKDELSDIGKRIQDILVSEVSKYPSLTESTVVKNPNLITWELDNKSQGDYNMAINYPDWFWIENGRGANKPMPPLVDDNGKTPILDWMKRKGIPESAQYAVRRSIGIRGIKARPFLDSALKKITPLLVSTIVNNQNIYIGEEINNIIKKINN